VQWLISLYENGLNGILADEMGLGKTLQVSLSLSLSLSPSPSLSLPLPLSLSALFLLAICL